MTRQLKARPQRRIAVATLGLFLSALLPGCRPAHEWHGTPYEGPPPAPPISLSRADGGEFALDQWRGDVVLLYFGYTHCPDVCPATLADLAWLKSTLADQGLTVRVAFITVDPERDTPAALQAYLADFDEDFVGLRGTEAQLAAAKEGYGIYSAADPSSDDSLQTFSHTARVFLIDAEGRLLASYDHETSRQDLLADVEHVTGG